MPYKVRIVPIISTFEIWKGPFQTEAEAWEWIDQHNCPFVDYEVVAIDGTDESPPWIE